MRLKDGKKENKENKFEIYIIFFLLLIYKLNSKNKVLFISKEKQTYLKRI